MEVKVFLIRFQISITIGILMITNSTSLCTCTQDEGTLLGPRYLSVHVGTQHNCDLLWRNREQVGATSV